MHLQNVRSSYKVKQEIWLHNKGNCYLGIDAGSTTTKTALVGEDGTLLYSFTAVTTETR